MEALGELSITILGRGLAGFPLVLGSLNRCCCVDDGAVCCVKTRRFGGSVDSVKFIYKPVGIFCECTRDAHPAHDHLIVGVFLEGLLQQIVLHSDLVSDEYQALTRRCHTIFALCSLRVVVFAV